MKVYYLIGDTGSYQYPNYWASTDEVDRDLRLCLYFLTDRYGSPPAGSELEIITATYHSDFRTIALGFDNENEPRGAFEYSQRLGMALQEFVESVDWKKIQPAAIESVIARKQRNHASVSGKSKTTNEETRPHQNN